MVDLVLDLASNQLDEVEGCVLNKRERRQLEVRGVVAETGEVGSVKLEQRRLVGEEVQGVVLELLGKVVEGLVPNQIERIVERLVVQAHDFVDLALVGRVVLEGEEDAHKHDETQDHDANQHGKLSRHFSNPHSFYSADETWREMEMLEKQATQTD